jgi:hypothetical protein
VVAARKAEHFRSVPGAERHSPPGQRITPVPGAWWARIRRASRRRPGARADPRDLASELAGALEEVAGMQPRVASKVAAELLNAPDDAKSAH